MYSITFLSALIASNLFLTAARRPNCKDTITAYPPDPSSKCCGIENDTSNKIVGGKATGIDQYPWLILLEYTINNERRICGGSLISGRYVLTAAHCVVGAVPPEGDSTYTVILGEYDRTTNGSDRFLVEAGGIDYTDGEIRMPVEKIIRHSDDEEFTAYRRNDIALIRLKEMAPYTDFIRPICLPSTDITSSPPSDLKLYVAGWGAFDETKVASSVKMDLEVPYINSTQCQDIYSAPGKEVDLVNTQICAGGETGKDSCGGDSGGPLMYERGNVYEAIGVVSFGLTHCGMGGFPTIYTKVFEYKDWIMKNIEP